MDKIKRALEAALDCLAHHSEWCGNKPGANGHPSINEAPKLIHAALSELEGSKPKEPHRYVRSGPPIQMQDVLLACGELNERERVAVQWVLDKINELPERSKPSLMVGFSEEEIIGMVDEYRENEEDAVGFEIASQRSVGYEDALEWVLDKINEIPAVKPTDEEIERVALDKYMKMNVRFAGHHDASEGKERTIYLKPVSPTPSEPDTDLVDKIMEVVKEATWINDVDLLRELLMKIKP